MYLGRADVFKCDTCMRTEAVDRWPKGWIWIKTGGVVKHACEKCKGAIPKHEQNEPANKKSK